MRSMLMVGALCSVVMMFTGCCSTNCNSRSLLGNRQAISSDCGCSDCSGASVGLVKARLSQSREASLHKRLSRVENRANVGGLVGRVASRNQGFVTAETAVETFPEEFEIQPVGGRVLGGRVAHAGGAIGCGRLGCGARGGSCRSGSCNARDRLAGARGRFGHTKPSGGTIPHTAAPPTFNGGPGGGGVPQFVYPYYTTRGPRDFLNTNPPSIGP